MRWQIEGLVSRGGFQNFVSILLLVRPKLRDGNVKFRGEPQSQARIAVDVECDICLISHLLFVVGTAASGSALSGAF